MFLIRLLLSVCLFCSSSLVIAGYGINSIGPGGESYGMGSADIARSFSVIGSNVNPAGMSKIENKNAVLYLEYYDQYGWEHEDSIGNKEGLDPVGAIVGGAGYAFRLTNHDDLVFGVTLLGQGGVGSTYPELLTTTGSKDELSATFGVFRIAPALAWQANDKLSLGISLGVNYAEADQNVFFNTSIDSPEEDEDFFGVKLSGLSGLSYSWRAGIQYQINDDLRVGMAYGSTTKLRLKDGIGKVNFDALGLGKVTYSNASIRGLELPQEFGIGLSWQANDHLEVAADINWINWSKSINSSLLELSEPDSLNVPLVLSTATPLNFRDQYAYSLGMRYHYKEGSWLMAGATYAKNPIPDEYVNPLFNTISKYHYIVGFTHKLTPTWFGTVTLLFSPENTVTYTTKGLPLGEQVTQRGEFADVTFTVERKW